MRDVIAEQLPLAYTGRRELGYDALHLVGVVEQASFSVQSQTDQY